ncbi:MAG: hypothetical protein PHH52_01360 [Patescibacteria group bacterium]|nr:hypothetical protein [Patescibacteria group bacterium]
MFSYRLIIKQAINIAWRYKYLWMFGIFASIVAASGSFEYQLISNNFQMGALESSYYFLGSIINVLETFALFILGIASLFTFDILTIINTLTVIVIVSALLIAFIWLAISSQGALVEAAQKIINGKKKLVKLNFRELMTAGHKKFWPVLGLNILIKLAITLILAIISVPFILLASKYSASLTLIYTLTFILFVPLTIACSLIIKYAIAYIIIDKEGLVSALKKSWFMFQHNWLVSLEMGIILFLINFFAGFILIILLSVIIFPYFIFAVDYGVIWLIITSALIALALIIVAGSFLTTFQISAWTNMFLELKNGNGQAKLERVFRKK